MQRKITSSNDNDYEIYRDVISSNDNEAYLCSLRTTQVQKIPSATFSFDIIRATKTG